MKNTVPSGTSIPESRNFEVNYYFELTKEPIKNFTFSIILYPYHGIYVLYLELIDTRWK